MVSQIEKLVNHAKLLLKVNQFHPSEFNPFQSLLIRTFLSYIICEEENNTKINGLYGIEDRANKNCLLYSSSHFRMVFFRHKLMFVHCFLAPSRIFSSFFHYLIHISFSLAVLLCSIDRFFSNINAHTHSFAMCAQDSWREIGSFL